jgi:hypothetical protein
MVRVVRVFDCVVGMENQDITEAMHIGVRLDILLVLRFTLWSFGLRHYVNW